MAPRVRFHGLQPLIDKYSNRLPQATQSRVIRGGMKQSVLYVHSRVPPYPPAPPASSYKRTGTLGRSITTEVRNLGARTVGLIGSAIIYAPYVISDQKVGSRGPQAKVHQGRWWTLQEVVVGARDGILRIFENAFRRAIKD